MKQIFKTEVGLSYEPTIKLLTWDIAKWFVAQGGGAVMLLAQVKAENYSWIELGTKNRWNENGFNSTAAAIDSILGSSDHYPKGYGTRFCVYEFNDYLEFVDFLTKQNVRYQMPTPCE